MEHENEPGLATGIHLVASAVIQSKTSTRAELDLAAVILRQNPKRELPRELEGAIQGFNRRMDAALESANRSSSCKTRAERRARLAADLERAGLVLIDQRELAELLERKLAGDDEESLGAELADGDEIFIGDVGRNPLPVPVE